MKLLLHSCCAPCFGYVYESLQAEYSVTPFFYNPNIAPVNEYKKRYKELEKYCAGKGVNLFAGEYDAKQWTSSVKQHRFKGERSERCWICYEIRLRKAFEFAKNNSFGLITTTLSISPHKDAVKINNIGKTLSAEFGIKFLEADFKKKDGFKKSLDLSKAHGFYRQNYCGCIYSKLESERNSLWYKKYSKRC